MGAYCYYDGKRLLFKGMVQLCLPDGHIPVIDI